MYEKIGIKDKHGGDICEGNYIKHNQNIFRVKWSKNRHEWVLRVDGTTNWRGFDWIKHVSKYLEIVDKPFDP